MDAARIGVAVGGEPDDDLVARLADGADERPDEIRAPGSQKHPLGIRPVRAGDVADRLLRTGSVLAQVGDFGAHRLREARDRCEMRLVETRAGRSLRDRGASERGDLVVRGAEGEGHAAHSGGFRLNTAEMRFKCQWSVVGFLSCS
jgi:hypothetical protein